MHRWIPLISITLIMIAGHLAAGEAATITDPTPPAGADDPATGAKGAAREE